ncbi:MAG: cation transporter [Ruminococcaceae bacterium]|nr:cation transporter [Oscillospiraceae bacterium]
MTNLLIKLFVKDFQNTKDNKVRENYGNLGSITGIACNLLLCILKITVGLVIGSISITADGLNNLSDMGSSVITMIGFKLSNKPADTDHPFGHGRMEYMSAFIVAILILLVGFELLKSSVTALINSNPAPTYSIISIIILAVSVVIKFWMYCFNRKIGKKIESESLLATAQDCLNDVIATTVILIAAGVTYFLNPPFNLDAVMGVAVAIFILISGINTAKETLNSILGAPPEKQLIEDIEKSIMSYPEFVGIHDLIVHNYGPGRQFASVHVEVPQDIDIVKCHEQIDICEKQIAETLGIQLVIHMDPIDVNNETVNNTKAELARGIKIIDENLTLHDFRMTPECEQQTNLIFDVVIPASCKLGKKELNKKISEIARLINPTFCCVITFDQNFIGE